jgi:hypothetical protein
MAPLSRHFPRRNRLISGMARGVVVIEAAERSGSLITANYALEQGREIFAVPGSPLDPRAKGANRLIKDGATLTEGADDVLAALRPILGGGFQDPPDERSPRASCPSSLGTGGRCRKGLVEEKLGRLPWRSTNSSASVPPACSVLTVILELELAGRSSGIPEIAFPGAKLKLQVAIHSIIITSSRNSSSPLALTRVRNLPQCPRPPRLTVPQGPRSAFLRNRLAGPMSEASSVVVVESPAKAKTINKYLGRNYRVLASYGHVRDLPAKDGSVDPNSDFAMIWEVDPKAQKRLKEIADAVKGADRLILATDPDREGEAISWHVLEALKQRRALGKTEVQRVVFNAVTKSAVLEAIAHPREINEELVDAYLARRALDYLVGFTLSPVLWRKLPGARSAGRVQSVALRLICERELEIEAFKPQEYWDRRRRLFDAGRQFHRQAHPCRRQEARQAFLKNADDAKRAVAAIHGGRFSVADVEKKPVKRHPAPPFITVHLAAGRQHASSAFPPRAR